MNLTDPEELSAFLKRHKLAALKELGQHFLCSAPVVRAIVEAVPLGSGILEIGPGPGILTGGLSEKGQTIALEIDPGMARALEESAPKAEVVLGDALQTRLIPLLERLPEPRAVVSNLPYYITGPLLGRITDAAEYWSTAVLMMQREVGNKILAEPGNSERGAISVRMQAHFTIRRLCLVPASAFLPPPKVESVVLVLEPKPCDAEEAMFTMVQRGFAQPRKTLGNNLAAAGFDRTAVEASGLRADVRPHQLTYDEWTRLWDRLR